MNCFELGHKYVKIFEKGEHEGGLYKNQIGAIGAAYAHFSTETGAALITMPTGTGKTAVMILLSYIFKCKKVLIITPSQLVRNQIAEQCRNPQILIRNNIINKDYLPATFELTSIEIEKGHWDNILKTNDVCVAIPGTLDRIIEIEGIIKKDAFDMIFVDEAHHSRAKSWSNILEYFKSAKQVLLTATPFRRDNKEIKARLIYDYPLRKAYEEKLFSQIKYIPLKRTDGCTDEQINIEIAIQTEKVYKKRAHLSHKIIVRTDSKNKADELLKIYKKATKLKLVTIHSRLSDSSILQGIKQLKAGKIDGVICVDMIGEGFDFPSLKIAAIHVPHKSLSITLQFVGRISRTNIESGNIATIIASEHDISIESAKLYQEDADWSIILPDLHRARIEKTKDEQDFSDTFENVYFDDSYLPTELNHLKLEINNFLPFFHVKLYRVFNKIGAGHIKQTNNTDRSLVDISKSIDFTNSATLINPILRHTTTSKDHQVAIHVVAQLKNPAWIIDNNDIKDIANELIIIYYNIENAILFICSTVKENELYEHIAESLLETDCLHEMIFLPQLKRAIAGWKNPKLYNQGLKSRKTKGTGEAYKTVLGSNVEEGVLPSDKFSYTRGHSFGGAFDTILEKEVILGISTSSKVWSLDEKKVIYLIKWCNEIAEKVGDPKMDNLPVPLSDLDTGVIVETFPNENSAFFADWDSNIYWKGAYVQFIDDDGILHAETLLCSCKIEIGVTTNDTIELIIKKSNYESKIIFNISPIISYKYDETTLYKLIIKQHFSTNKDYILQILKEYPIHIFYEDLSSLSGKVYFKSRLSISTFSIENFIRIKWPNNVEVHKEAWNEDVTTARLAGQSIPLSIHEYIIELAKNEFECVFYDHASLEIADVIGLKNGLIKFYHCKKQDSHSPRCSVDDMYEVIGQATKSVNWANKKVLIQQLIKRSEKNNIAEKIKKGSVQQIKSILDSFANPIIPIEIVIVQPGLKIDNLTINQEEAFKRINILLSGSEEYLKSVSRCNLKVMCS